MVSNAGVGNHNGACRTLPHVVITVRAVLGCARAGATAVSFKSTAHTRAAVCPARGPPVALSFESCSKPSSDPANRHVYSIAHLISKIKANLQRRPPSPEALITAATPIRTRMRPPSDEARHGPWVQIAVRDSAPNVSRGL